MSHYVPFGNAILTRKDYNLNLFCPRVKGFLSSNVTLFLLAKGTGKAMQDKKTTQTVEYLPKKKAQFLGIFKY